MLALVSLSRITGTMLVNIQKSEEKRDKQAWTRRKKSIAENDWMSRITCRYYRLSLRKCWHSSITY
jgi:hypothetical protein